MVKYSSQNLDTIFSALSDATRRAILERLARGEASVTELAEPFEISLPAISKHLRILENAGLIIRRKEGRVHHMHLAPVQLKDASNWLQYYRRFWEDHFDALADYLAVSEDEPFDEHE